MRKIHIKNMVCSRCTEAVESIFKDQGIGIKNIQLGEVIVDEITDLQLYPLLFLLLSLPILIYFEHIFKI